MVYIENEGALFRGPSRAWPKEVWVDGAFRAYTGSAPKDIEWGSVIDEDTARRMMAEASEGAGKTTT